MSRVAQAQAWFEGVEVVTTVSNTFQPRLDGSRRTIEKLGKSFFDGRMLDDVDDRLRAGMPFHGTIPSRARDVVAISDTEITFRLDLDPSKGEHTVTYRKQARDG